MMYTYYLTQRPAGPGALPQFGLNEIESYDEKSYVPDIGREAYAQATYTRPLTLDEIDQYELTPKERIVMLTPAEIEIIRHALKFDAAHGNGAYREGELALFKRLGGLE